MSARPNLHGLKSGVHRSGGDQRQMKSSQALMMRMRSSPDVVVETRDPLPVLM